MEASLRGRKALVVGGSGGMGLATAVALSREGVSCALIGRDAEKTAKAAAVCAEANTTAHAIVCDIAEAAALKGAVRQAIEMLGGLHFLVNCAGTHINAKAQEADLAAWDSVLDTNFRAIYHLARHALPEINKAPGGAVISIGSITAPYAGAGMHIAAKRALAGYSEALFEDVRDYGTKVCVIHPGYVNTPMVRSDRLDRSRMIQPEDIARTVLFVLTMPATACPTEITLRPQRSPYRSA